MDDDIVERLRDIAARCWCAEKSQGEPVGKPFFRCESCDDQLCAADEIERLREQVEWASTRASEWKLETYQLNTEIDRLRAMCNDLYHDATCPESFCRLCGEGIREWEARRG